MGYLNLCAVVACLVVCSLSVQCFDFPESNKGIFEGDIFYEFPKGGRMKRNVVRYRRLLWPNGDVPYVLSRSIKSRPNYVRVIKEAIREWEQNTCIRFKERKREKSYAYFFRGTGCYAKVGAGFRGQTPVSLGSRCDDFGVAVHELGHVVGFFHEHTRADRDKYVRVLWNNIRDKGKRAFKIRSKRMATSLGFPYDYNSAMHYGKYHMSKNGWPTLLPRDRSIRRLGGRNLSPLDILQANVLYNCLEHAEFPKDFSWQTRVQNGQRCIRIDEPQDSTWRTRYLCYPIMRNDLGLFWSNRGNYYWAAQCTWVRLRSKSYYGPWSNNYFCYPRNSPYIFYWSARRPYARMGCLKTTIDKIPYYLCAKKKYGVKLRVHGRWSPWSKWSPCTLKCGGGVRISYRNCSTPQNGGKTCVGPNIRKVMCNIQACPPWPSWTSEFRLGRYNRVPSGMSCVTIFDEQRFRLCWKTTGRREVNVVVSQNTNVTDKRCTSFPGPRDSNGTWQNKTLCLPKSAPYNFQISTAGPIARKRCLPFGRSLRGRENTYLCATAKFVCPAFWIPFKQGDNFFCYQKIDMAMTWDQAQRVCKRLGANLATITSKNESDFVYKIRDDRHRWIGFNDKRREGTFEWIDGSPVTYTRWSRGDPNDGNTKKNEDCVMMNRGSSRWNDWPCSTKFEAICKVVAG